MLKAASLKSAMFKRYSVPSGSACSTINLISFRCVQQFSDKTPFLVSRNHCRHYSYSHTHLKSFFKYQFIRQKDLFQIIIAL